jgi:putative ABC transport system permease protein
MSMVIRASGAAPDIAATVRKQIAGLNLNVPITHLEPLSSVVERARAESRFLSVLATLLSVLALQLALGGIYGVLSYSVVLRTSEIGIRMAVGAQRMQIMRLVLAEGFVSVALGTAMGVLLSVVSMPLLGHLLFGITPGSLQNYGLVTTALLLLSGLSMLIPALRAMKVNPLAALACE